MKVTSFEKPDDVARSRGADTEARLPKKAEAACSTNKMHLWDVNMYNININYSKLSSNTKSIRT